MRTYAAFVVVLVCATACGNVVESGIAEEDDASSDLTPSIDEAPLLQGIGVSSVTTDSAVINWTTDRQATSDVEYGTTTRYGQATPLYGLSTAHSVALTGLEAATLYHYRVKSMVAGAKIATSADFTFTTAAADAGPVDPTDPTPPGTPPGTPPNDPPPNDPPPSSGTHRFPYSFTDQGFFANATASGTANLACGSTLADKTITTAANGDPVIINGCGNGTTNVTRVRLGGDGVNGSVREGFRCGGDGTMNISNSWLEATGAGDDHADVIQCYDPNNAPTAVMNVSHTTIRGHDTAANAGLFVADSYALELHLDDVLFWGSPFGLRFHTDGRPGSLYLNNVCFYGTGPNDHSFGYGPFLLDPYRPTIAQWTNVNWCTIEGGQLVVHGAIPKP